MLFFTSRFMIIYYFVILFIKLFSFFVVKKKSNLFGRMREKWIMFPLGCGRGQKWGSKCNIMEYLLWSITAHALLPRVFFQSFSLAISPLHLQLFSNYIFVSDYYYFRRIIVDNWRRIPWRLDVPCNYFVKKLKINRTTILALM